jgi:LysR family transcriptional regulator, hca operon transcriptional activator
MELRHLRYFIAVAETGSLTVAAEQRLHTSQPSLSRQIRDLEDEVGAALFNRSARGVELTAAGKAFMDHARLALAQAEAAVEAARRAARPAKQAFALGFLTGQEMTWLPRAMQLLRDELPNIDVTVSSQYSPDLADQLARGKLDLAFMRAEPGFDLDYRVIHHEALVVLMPSDHRLTARASIRAEDLIGERFILASYKARVLFEIVERYLQQNHIDVTPEHGIDNLAMAMSLVASTRALALMPEYANHFLPWSVVSRPLAGEAPMIDLVIGYSRANTSPVLKLFMSKADELTAALQTKSA